MKTARIFNTDKVRIRRHGSAVVPEPTANDWAWLEAVTGPLDDDFVKAVTEQPDVQKPYQGDV